MNILIIRLGAIGDVLRTTALLPGLKAKYPDCRVFWVARENALDVLKYNPLVDKLFAFDKAQLVKLKDEFFELVLCLDDELESAQLASGVKSARVFGLFVKDGVLAYSDDSAPWFDMLPVSRLGAEDALKLRKANGRSYQEILYDALALDKSLNRIGLSLDDKNKVFSVDFLARHRLKPDDFIVGVNAGAGSKWLPKKLTVEKSVELIDVLLERGYKVVLLGGPEEAERNKSIAEHFGAEIADSGTANSLLGFAAVLSVCSVVVSSDSLALHIAVALGKPVVAFFGPTSAAEVEIYGRGVKVLPEMECLCCFRTSCDLSPSCTSLVDIGDIVDSIEKFRV
jgi:heptosyltransferase-2